MALKWSCPAGRLAGFSLFWDNFEKQETSAEIEQAFFFNFRIKKGRDASLNLKGSSWNALHKQRLIQTKRASVRAFYELIILAWGCNFQYLQQGKCLPGIQDKFEYCRRLHVNHRKQMFLNFNLEKLKRGTLLLQAPNNRYRLDEFSYFPVRMIAPIIPEPVCTDKPGPKSSVEIDSGSVSFFWSSDSRTRASSGLRT